MLQQHRDVLPRPDLLQPGAAVRHQLLPCWAGLLGRQQLLPHQPGLQQQRVLVSWVPDAQQVGLVWLAQRLKLAAGRPAAGAAN